MAYGLRTYDDDGNVLVDFSTQLTRLLHREFVPKGTSGHVQVPGFNAGGGHAWPTIVLPDAPFTFWTGIGDPLVFAPSVSWFGDDIYWTTGTGDAYIYVLMWGQA